MKKLLALVLAILMVASILVSCDDLNQKERKTAKFNAELANEELGVTFDSGEAFIDYVDENEYSVMDFINPAYIAKAFGNLKTSANAKGLAIAGQNFSGKAAIETKTVQEILALATSGELSDPNDLLKKWDVTVTNSAKKKNQTTKISLVMVEDEEEGGFYPEVALNGKSRADFETGNDFTDYMIECLGYDLGSGNAIYKEEGAIEAAVEELEGSVTIAVKNLGMVYELPEELAEVVAITKLNAGIDGAITISVENLQAETELSQKAGSERYEVTRFEGDVTIASKGFGFYIGASYGEDSDYQVGLKLKIDTTLHAFVEQEYDEEGNAYVLSDYDILCGEESVMDIIEDIMAAFTGEEPPRTLAAINSELSKLGVTVVPFECVQNGCLISNAEDMIDYLLDLFLPGEDD